MESIVEKIKLRVCVFLWFTFFYFLVLLEYCKKIFGAFCPEDMELEPKSILLDGLVRLVNRQVFDHFSLSNLDWTGSNLMAGGLAPNKA